MRPPAPVTRKWVSEKNSFPVRGLVMYRWPKTGWGCNVELLRITREQIDLKPADETAFEIALSALHRHIAQTPGHTFDGETIPVTTARGNIVEVPALAFELAPYFVDKVKKLIEEGGGSIGIALIGKAHIMHARASTGSAKDADAFGMPVVGGSAVRKKKRLEHEDRAVSAKLKGMAARRRMLGKFWLKYKQGFHRRGLVFTTDAGLFWRFNVDAGPEHIDSVPHSSTDEKMLRELALSVSRAAINKFASAINVEKGDERLLCRDKFERSVDDALTNEIRETASARLAARLLQGMAKHGHGTIGLSTIERCLVLAWDPADDKPLDDYPFPLAPTESPQVLDRWALDALHERVRRLARARPSPVAAQPAHAQDQHAHGVQSGQSWREELEINDWVPLEDPVEDDETIDRRAMQLADHEQSAALRRIREDTGGTKNKQGIAQSIKHDIDYAGLPKDVD